MFAIRIYLSNYWIAMNVLTRKRKQRFKLAPLFLWSGGKDILITQNLPQLVVSCPLWGALLRLRLRS